MDRLSITVLAGGPSAEREVSFMGGQAVAEALARLGHDARLADITPTDLSALDRPGVDVFFLVLHGPWGEDGQLQQLLERRGLVYTGSGPAAAALAMNKAAAKSAFRAAGLPTPDWQVVTERGAEPRAEARGCAGGNTGSGCPVIPASFRSRLEETCRKWRRRLPVVVKPTDQGSSVDLTIVREAEQLQPAVAAVCRKYGRCLLEKFVAGRELTVGVLDGAAGAPKPNASGLGTPLPAIEIVVHGHEFYDYQAKYFDDGTEYIVAPELPAGAERKLRDLALAAHRTLGCRDMSRVDFILDGAGRPFILEVNAIPGFTSHSLLPKAAAGAGLDFAGLCQRLVELALRRGGRKTVPDTVFPAGRALKAG